jgi:hypothetical protein
LKGLELRWQCEQKKVPVAQGVERPNDAGKAEV